MKKLTLILIALLLCTAMVFGISCGNGGTDTDTDTNSDTGNNTSSDTDSDVGQLEAKTYTVTVKDQDGNALGDVEIELYDENDNVVKAVTTNENGVATFTIKEGEAVRLYTSRVPELHFSASSDIGSSTDIALEVYDNTPNGTPERPFVFDNESDSFTVELGASERVYYVLYGGGGRTFEVNNADGVKITVGDVELDVVDSSVSYDLPEVDASSRVTSVVFENTKAEGVTLNGKLVSPLGAFDNPYVVENVGEVQTVMAQKGSIIYYQFTATRTGVVLATAENESTSLYMQNLTTSQVSERGSSISLNVREGETVRIEVSSISDRNYAEVSFIVTEE